jgi:hypothetical protein
MGLQLLGGRPIRGTTGYLGLGICLERDRDFAEEICAGVLHTTHTRPTVEEYTRP